MFLSHVAIQRACQYTVSDEYRNIYAVHKSLKNIVTDNLVITLIQLLSVEVRDLQMQLYCNCILLF